MQIAIRLAALALLVLPLAALAEPLALAGLAFPDSIGGFTRGEVRDFEKTNPGLGQSIAYERGPWHANVYVYDLRLSTIPDDLNSDVVRAQLEQAKGDIFRTQQMGTYLKVELARSYSLPDAGRQRFICASFDIASRTVSELDSTLCVTAWKNKFVKFRVTGPRQSRDTAQPTKFVEAWSQMLWP